MRRNGEHHPSEVLDEMLRRKWLEDRHYLSASNPEKDELVKKQAQIARLARYVMHRGSYVARWEEVIATNPDEREELSDDPYEYIGTLFVPVDFNRSISVRQIPRQNPDEDIKAALILSTGEKEPQDKTLAVFSGDNSMELNTEIIAGSLEDFNAVEALLRYIAKTDEAFNLSAIEYGQNNDRPQKS